MYGVAGHPQGPVGGGHMALGVAESPPKAMEVAEATPKG